METQSARNINNDKLNHSFNSQTSDNNNSFSKKQNNKNIKDIKALKFNLNDKIEKKEKIPQRINSTKKIKSQVKSNNNLKPLQLNLEEGFNEDKIKILLDIKNIIDVKKTERSINDLKCISEFLFSSKLSLKLKHDGLSNDNFLKILASLSNYVTFKKYQPKEYVFYQGDNSDKFYIIVDGDIQVLNDNQYTENMNANEYFNFIIQLKIKDETQLLDKIIKINNAVFPIEHKDIKNISKNYKILQYKQILTNLSFKLLNNPIYNEIIELVLEISEIYSLIKSQVAISSTIDYIEDKENLITLKMLLEQSNKKVRSNDKENKIDFFVNIIRNDLAYLQSDHSYISKYNYFLKTNKEKVTLIERKAVYSFTSWDYFGDVGLDLTKCRTASIRTKTEAIILSISSQVYKEFIIAESNKITNKLITVLLDNYFLKTIGKSVFLLKYYHLFKYKAYQKGYVFGEKDNNQDKIYLIISGKVNITLNMSIIELNQYYKSYLKHMLGNIEKIKKSDQKIECLKQKIIDLSAQEFHNNTNFMTSKQDPILDLKEIKNRKELIINTIQDINILAGEEYVFGDKWLKNAIAETEVKLFEIDNESLDKIMREEDCKYELLNYSLMKSICFLEHINSLRLNKYYNLNERKFHLKINSMMVKEVSNNALKINAVLGKEPTQKKENLRLESKDTKNIPDKEKNHKKIKSSVNNSISIAKDIKKKFGLIDYDLDDRLINKLSNELLEIKNKNFGTINNLTIDNSKTIGNEFTLNSVNKLNLSKINKLKLPKLKTTTDVSSHILITDITCNLNKINQISQIIDISQPLTTKNNQSRNYLISSIKNNNQLKRIHDLTKSLEKKSNYNIKQKQIKVMKNLCLVEKIKFP